MGKLVDSRPYCINDFREWDERKELILEPYFQRRDVWSEKARSYLIDTILRGLPMPKIYMRHYIDPATRKSRREIVDGQQRLKSILGFLKDGFKVLKTQNQEYGNMFYSDLPAEVQEDFLKYEISTDLIRGSEDELVLDIFARINTYTVTLNPQELLNAKYFGDFKQTVYRLGWEFYTFWKDNKILTQRQILRMGEAELSSELVIAMMGGIQSKSNPLIESYYKKYDDKLPKKEEIVKRFKVVMDAIGEIFENNLPVSKFHNRAQFYTFFCVIYDLMYEMKNSSTKKRIKITPNKYAKIRSAIAEMEGMFENKYKHPKFEKFVDAFLVHRTSLKERRSRHAQMAKIILKSLKD